MVLTKMKTAFCAGLMVSCILCFSLHQDALCAEPVSVKNDLLSVSLRDTSLLEVARNIERQSGVWFKGDEALFQERISVAFNDLPFEEGLKRILANLNYSLVFDSKNKVAGVMVMGEGKPSGTQPARPGAQPPRVATPPTASTRPAPAVRSRPSTTTPPPATVRRPPRALPQTAPGAPSTQPPGSSAVQSPLPDAFKAQEGASTPGGTAASDGPLPPAFRVTETPPPAGVPPQGAASGPGDAKPETSAQPPGDASKSDRSP